MGMTTISSGQSLSPNEVETNKKDVSFKKKKVNHRQSFKIPKGKF